MTKKFSDSYIFCITNTINIVIFSKFFKYINRVYRYNTSKVY
jgi:hypothetical protein